MKRRFHGKCIGEESSHLHLLSLSWKKIFFVLPFEEIECLPKFGALLFQLFGLFIIAGGAV